MHTHVSLRSHTCAHTCTAGMHPYLPTYTHLYTCILHFHIQLHTHQPLHTHLHTDTYVITCQHSTPAPLHTHTHACTHTPMHTCTLHVHPNPTARTLVFLEDRALRLMLGLCPTFLKILWCLANGPRPSAGCLRSPLLPTPPPRQGSRGQGQACGTDSSLTSPTAGADHHHVRVGQPQWLCGSRLSVCTQAAHHPVSAAKECGQPPHAHQPLRQCSCQSQLQPRPRSASICDKPLPQLSAWGPLPGLLRFLGWGWSAP